MAITVAALRETCRPQRFRRVRICLQEDVPGPFDAACDAPDRCAAQARIDVIADFQPTCGRRVTAGPG